MENTSWLDCPFELNQEPCQFSHIPLKQQAIQQNIDDYGFISSLGVECVENQPECANLLPGQVSSGGLKESEHHHINLPGISNKNKRKRELHRDIERQRRREVATLYDSLRSLLPLQCIKGRRSMSDHMNQATNYIKILENRIKELNEKKEVLKRQYNLQCPDNEKGSLNSVTVSPSWPGAEVAIKTAFRQGIPLSKILNIISAEGLNVINCISTKRNGNFLHIIKAVVMAGRSIDLSELEHKLANLAH